MPLLRALVVLTVLLAGSGVVAYLATGDLRFRRFSLLVLKVAGGAALVAMALMVLERLMVL